MKYPLVTVITPTYNRADCLTETIESVLSQGYTNLQFIILDDGSTDNTLDVLAKYADRVVWASHLNMGEAETVNRGFRMARGDIFGVVNSDDPLLPNAINNIVAFMQNNPDFGVVYPDWDMIDGKGQLISHVKTFNYNYINMLRWHHCIPGPGAFFKREIVDSLGGRDPQFRYVNDFDFWLRAGLITKFARLPKTLATFRVHPGSISFKQKNEMMAKEHIVLINKIYSLPNLVPEANKYKREAFSSAYYMAGRVCESCDLGLMRHYFFMAIRYASWKYLGEYRKDRLRYNILPKSFPALFKFLSRTRRSLKSVLSIFEIAN